MSISKDFRNIIDTLAKKGTQPLDAEGVVKRIDDGYAWVHLTDGVDETPVQLTINAQPGDKVRVRSAKGRMWITGNLSSPPTDDKVANEAKRIATSVGKGVSKQIGEIRTIADEAGEIAGYAMESADGKSTVYHMATAPTGGDYKVGDTWFNSSEGYAIYTWNGTAWVKEELGSDAIANLAITNAKIANATIQSAKIAALDAGKITSGTISSARIDTANLTIGDTTLGSKVNDAETKATGFIYSDGNGIKIARTNPSGASTYQYLTSTKNQFYANGVEVSSYSDSKVELGKNAVNSIIEMCKGSILFSAAAESGWDGIQLDITAKPPVSLDNRYRRTIYLKTDGGNGTSQLYLSESNQDGTTNYSGTTAILHASWMSGIGGDAEVRCDADINGSKVSISAERVDLDGYLYGNNYRLAIDEGDSLSVTWHGSGYITDGSKQLRVTVPFNRVIAASSVSVSDAKLITRQGNKYTHGSSDTASVAWSIDSAAIVAGGVQLMLRRTTTTNATNNSPIGVHLTATFTFS